MKKMQNNKLDFMGAEEYSFEPKGITFKEIVLKHLNKILEITTHEFTEGREQKKPIAIGSAIAELKTYTEDKREAYINAVDSFYDILSPHFDQKMKDADKKIQTELKSAEKTFGSTFLTKEGLENVEKSALLRKIRRLRKALINPDGFDVEDLKKEAEGNLSEAILTREERVLWAEVEQKIKRKLFRELNFLCFRKRYFEGKTIKDV